jgi:uncharacterized membrane protein
MEFKIEKEITGMDILNAISSIGNYVTIFIILATIFGVGTHLYHVRTSDAVIYTNTSQVSINGDDVTYHIKYIKWGAVYIDNGLDDGSNIKIAPVFSVLNINHYLSVWVTLLVGDFKTISIVPDGDVTEIKLER